MSGVIGGNINLNNGKKIVYLNENKMVKVATRASEYLDSSSVQYTEKSDRFIHSHTSSYTVSESSGGSGGGAGGG